MVDYESLMAWPFSVYFSFTYFAWNGVRVLAGGFN